MTIQDAIKKLQKMGYKIYPRGEEFAVWGPGQKNNSEEFRYSVRSLIKFAAIAHSPRHGRPSHGLVGCGGLYCPCCAPPSKHFKRQANRAVRRAGNIFEDYL